MRDWDFLEAELKPVTNDWSILLGIDPSLVSRIKNGHRNFPPLTEAHFSQALRILATLPPLPTESASTQNSQSPVIQKMLVKARLDQQKVAKKINDAISKRKIAQTRLAWIKVLMDEPDPANRPLSRLFQRWERQSQNWLRMHSEEEIALLQMQERIIQFSIAQYEEACNG